jgi:hypothetical protein
MTGVCALAVGTVAKRLQLLHEWVPALRKSRFSATRPIPILAHSKPENCKLQPLFSGVRMLLLDASKPTRDRK